MMDFDSIPFRTPCRIIAASCSPRSFLSIHQSLLSSSLNARARYVCTPFTPSSRGLACISDCGIAAGIKKRNGTGETKIKDAE